MSSVVYLVKNNEHKHKTVTTLKQGSLCHNCWTMQCNQF